MTEYIPIIGLEIHIQLRTKSKMFCGCAASWFGKEPNTLTCPVCLGLPGALPVPNRKAVDWTIMLGLALNCKIAKESHFDRKNYFYPDLPKGYQISQFAQPLCKIGKLAFEVQGSRFEVRIKRVHLEEDTGKLVHRKTAAGDSPGVKTPDDPLCVTSGVTLVDFNRSGIPLVEIVTEPDLRSSEEAVLFMKKLRQIVRYLGISDADMEKGSMRIEPNVSIREIRNSKFEIRKKWQTPNSKSKTNAKENSKYSSTNYQLPSYKVEVKNINSFKFAKKAIDYEIERQINLLKRGKTPKQETRGWDEKKGKTVSQRFKEEAQDYRYFPEPDIPSMRFSDTYIHRLETNIHELPEEKADRFIEEYGISYENAQLLTVDRELADWFEEAVEAYVQTAYPGTTQKNKSTKIQKSAYAGTIANWVIHDLAGLMKKENMKLKNLKIFPSHLAELLYLLDREEISQSAAKKVFEEVFKTGERPTKVVKDRNLGRLKNLETLRKIVEKVLEENKKAVEDYKAGKKEAIRFLVGQVMRETGGRANGEGIKAMLTKILNHD